MEYIFSNEVCKRSLKRKKTWIKIRGSYWMEYIYFFSEIEFSLDDESRVRQWIKSTIEAEERQLREISVIFCDDNYLLSLNQKYLSHDTLTDILTFNRSKDKQIAGDIYISVDRIQENAMIFQASFREELCRVLIHGILHLIGFTDKSEENKKIMRSKEDEYLLLLSKRNG